jgi:hypothetical protein
MVLMMVMVVMKQACRSLQSNQGKLQIISVILLHLTLSVAFLLLYLQTLVNTLKVISLRNHKFVNK